MSVSSKCYVCGKELDDSIWLGDVVLCPDCLSGLFRWLCDRYKEETQAKKR